MQKLVLRDGTEFEVRGVFGTSEKLTIDFAEGVMLQDVLAKFDSYNNAEFDEDNLRRFELHNEDGLQGVHNGYTQVKAITTSGGLVSLNVEREDEVKTDLVYLAQQVTDLELIVLGGM